MGNFSSFQRQQHKPSTASQPSFVPHVRPIASVTSSSPVSAPVNEDASLEHARRFRDALGRMSIFPPEHNAVPTRNNTGLPDTLKAGVEHLSGVAMDDVRVHYNSAKPAQLQALAYTQGTKIHVGSGQEQHLAHEAWHVVQQKQGRVRPTLQAKGMKINDDERLEQEAEAMGAQAAIQYKSLQYTKIDSEPYVQGNQMIVQQLGAVQKRDVIQRILSGPDCEALTTWLEKQKLKLEPTEIQNLCNNSKNLEDAKQEALNMSALHFSGQRAKKMQGDITKYEAKKAKEELQLMADVVAELISKGLGKAVPVAIASLAEVLISEFPPKNNTYILMGNSPAPLMAWLEINGLKDNVFHLPLGGLTAGNAPAHDRQSYLDLLQSPKGKKIADYFDLALTPAIKRDKPLVLVDYTDTGGSLVYTLDLVKAWLNSKNIETQVQFFAYSQKNAEELDLLMKSGHEGVLATSVGKMEKIFTKMNKDKLLKNAMLLKGPASLEINDLLENDDPAQAVINHLEYYQRLLTLMKHTPQGSSSSKESDD